MSAKFTTTAPLFEFSVVPRLSKWSSVHVYWAAAGIGLLGQASVIVFGALATFYWRYEKDDAPPQTWAFPLMISRTVLLSCGMFWCACLVERSTKERVFRRDKPCGNVSVYVTQPGNQTIGDQTYDPFAFSHSSDPLKEYITSWKAPQRLDERHTGVWLATGSSMIGFILQFVGLRAMHSLVSILLLAAIVIMSICTLHTSYGKSGGAAKSTTPLP
ncbi:hypothetical protein LZ31DRAFT_227091 [Colletotrichum somersetense]|nr:hypothetical protein LZ31DRAFT_227091 [Colletotrichum somersetense]